MSQEIETAEWWSVSQAVSWIVTRDVNAVRNTSATAGFHDLPFLVVNQSTDAPPIEKQHALPEIVRVWRSGGIELRGMRKGSELKEVIPRGSAPFEAWFLEHAAGIALAIQLTPPMLDPEFWFGVWVRRTECQGCWPQGASRTASFVDAEPEVKALIKPTLRVRATDDEICAWVVGERERRIRDGARHSRHEIVPVAARRFGVTQDAIRALWDVRGLAKKSN